MHLPSSFWTVELFCYSSSNCQVLQHQHGLREMFCLCGNCTCKVLQHTACMQIVHGNMLQNSMS